MSCGAFHTLAVANDGLVYAFGQAKYGKLGLNRQNSEGVFNVPQKVETLLKDTTFISAHASYNHSLILSKSDSGSLFSFGFTGKGLLGRVSSSSDNIVPLPIPNIEIFHPQSNPNDATQSKNQITISTEVVQAYVRAL